MARCRSCGGVRYCGHAARGGMRLTAVRSFRFRRRSAEALTWLATVALLVAGSLLPEADTGMPVAPGRDLLALRIL